MSDRSVADYTGHSNLNPLNSGISAVVHHAAIAAEFDVAVLHFVRVIRRGGTIHPASATGPIGGFHSGHEPHADREKRSK